MEDRKRIIKSGGRGSGKTTFCQALVDLARSAGWEVAGVLSPPILVNGQKIGIDIVDLSTNQSKRLANTIDRGGDGTKTNRWAFDDEALSWGNQVLGNIPPCDLLVVDELGPLEFERGEGWLNGLLAVSDGDYRLVLVVIRPELVGKALELWPDAEVLEMIEPRNAAVLSEEFFRSIST